LPALPLHLCVTIDGMRHVTLNDKSQPAQQKHNTPREVGSTGAVLVVDTASLRACIAAYIVALSAIEIDSAFGLAAAASKVALYRQSATMQSLQSTDANPPDGTIADESSVDEALVEAIYNHVAASLVRDLTVHLHERLKTGGITYPQLSVSPFHRAALYPDLYTEKDNVDDIVRQYAVQVPPSKLDGMPTFVADIDEPTAPKANETSSTAPPIQSSLDGLHQPVAMDIWGRQPSKEPADMIECTICHKPFSVSKWAPHVEKCVGGSMRSLSTSVQRASSDRSHK
jgi:hypothetical protein